MSKISFFSDFERNISVKVVKTLSARVEDIFGSKKSGHFHSESASHRI